MAVYKVPQDVEAEDKLLGPFSFRQFIYLIVAALGGFLAYALGQVFIALGIIPLPIVFFFLIIALPLKKDQPMETYLTAVVRYFLKPRRRLWDPEGNIALVEITAAHVDEGPALKEFSGNEASERLHYLSQLVDTGGWSTRGLTSPLDNISLNDTVVAEAQSAKDVLDTTDTVSQNLNAMIDKSDETRRQSMIQTMQENIQASTEQGTMTMQQLYGIPDTTAPSNTPSVSAHQPLQSPAAPQQTVQTPVQPQVSAPPQQQEPDSSPAFSPYPSSIHQRVIAPSAPAFTPTATNTSPASQPLAQTQAQASSEDPVSPDIMRLATNKDLSISTIAREAERLQKKHLDEEEVVVSLR